MVENPYQNGNRKCSKHIVLALKVKSILVPHQDENNDMEDDEAISLGVDSVPTTDPPNPDNEMSHSMEDDGYIVSHVDKTSSRENNGMADREDDIQDRIAELEALLRTDAEIRNSP
ncbi:meiosis-specific protein ASY1-like [Papaver somniferum]|uniref:meiosis-specific protein ASY1-like n=1 Tax=Papaver somniferum TaxID=3469 RepID=UPI000E705CAA|nr:meiosis-specific protein ASY1-like [Papaver somniferum]XP_026433378.1 meiosis-specific protein ASY1-like [Papaver somniferum]XP_026433379.1 meiosis-specific protein ASY1-like [Papaver somniferum]XP_026433380.1 meiosis-specific protein ASY1-like [Papaver somniferum]XP_026433381.1 meiosis-specific protein ASY1-like [Papaver somniferum]XP_026433382.1 meiosis-specific protein ASY1-like [Papaver somniferum]XP_026433383.1 meiosis-specific protein ASY1-like [Papaver somniferum]XP_026433384.1 mei